MKKNYFENIDPRPKRKMHRDNPYRIFSIGCNTEKPHYYVKFLDNLGVEICLEISKELFDFFDGCELKIFRSFAFNLCKALSVAFSVRPNIAAISRVDIPI